MCGIVAILNVKKQTQELRQKALKMSQKIRHRGPDWSLAVNGEIYNHQEIRRRYAGQYEFQTGSDCEVILPLYREKGIDFLEDLSGIFAFVLYDEERDEFLIARDPIGVIPLYIGYDSDGTVYPVRALRAVPSRTLLP